MNLEGKIVVITGGCRGLGKELTSQFVQEGAKVTIADIQQEEGQKTATELGADFIMCDVTKESDVQNLANEVLEIHGQIDIWINNAGVWLPHASVEETNWQRVHEIFEVNVFGTIYGSKTALIQMRKQTEGTIINVLSTSALEGRLNSSGYCASKYAASGFTKSLRKEVTGTDIKIFGIYPSGMQTNLFDEGKPAGIDEYMQPDYVASKIIENLKLTNGEEELIIKK
jgi:NAD(P)-dependent dehydrogenase (short-subunit alcohol dehydrogenase family)